MAKFWKAAHEWARGHFKLTFKTRFGWFGIYLWGLVGFEIYLGRLCKIVMDFGDRKSFFICFLQREYQHSLVGPPQKYWAYRFGHAIEWVSSGDSPYKFLPVSQWYYGKFRPYAPKVNTRKGKILGIGYGKKTEEKPIFNFGFPLCYFRKELSDWLIKNSWYVCSCENEENCPGGKCEYPLSQRIIIPSRPRQFLRPGDVVMFFDEGDDQFYEIQAEDIDEWKKGKGGLLPHGIVFRPSS